MILKDDFFKITDIQEVEGSVDYEVELNPEHFIYQAHFPGNPVTPGVCLVQMVEELTQESLQKNLLLRQADKIRFLHIIDPRQQKRVNISLNFTPLTDGEYKVEGKIYQKELTFAQLTMLMVNSLILNS